ncbi:MAG: hypothetical protein UU56_C0002G0111, partial [Candidatus Curtissbacteria bacterium GW2011_GWA2_41_24]
ILGTSKSSEFLVEKRRGVIMARARYENQMTRSMSLEILSLTPQILA